MCRETLDWLEEVLMDEALMDVQVTEALGARELLKTAESLGCNFGKPPYSSSGSAPHGTSVHSQREI